MQRFLTFALAGLIVTGCNAQSLATQFPERFELVTIQIGDQQEQVQLADNEAKRRQGLMGQIPLQHGMLLLHQTPKAMVLWMKNTPSALDVAFIDANWKIVGLAQMQSFSEDLHESPGPVLGALEMPQGWFSKANVKLGQSITLCQQSTCQSSSSTSVD